MKRLFPIAIALLTISGSTAYAQNASAPSTTRMVSATPTEPTPTGNPEITPATRKDAAKFHIKMPMTAACQNVKKYLISKEIEIKDGDCATGQITTNPIQKNGWTGQASRRTIISFVEDGTQTEIRVRVMKTATGFFTTNGDKSKHSDEKISSMDQKSTTEFATELCDNLSKNMK